MIKHSWVKKGGEKRVNLACPCGVTLIVHFSRLSEESGKVRNWLLQVKFMITLFIKIKNQQYSFRWNKPTYLNINEYFSA